MALKKNMSKSVKAADEDEEIVDVTAEEMEEEETEVAEEAAPEEAVVEATVAEVGGPTLVSVLPNQNGRFYYGDRYYDLIQGQTLQVPKGFKERLKDAGMLDVQ